MGLQEGMFRRVESVTFFFKENKHESRIAQNGWWVVVGRVVLHCPLGIGFWVSARRQLGRRGEKVGLFAITNGKHFLDRKFLHVFRIWIPSEGGGNGLHRASLVGHSLHDAVTAP